MKKYYILAITFFCLLMGQNSYGQSNGNGDYVDTGDICDENSSAYDMCACNHYDWCELDEICIGPGCPGADTHDPCDIDSSSWNPCVCDPSWCDSGDVCDPNSSAYDYDTCHGTDDDDDEDYCYYYPEICYPDDPNPDTCTTTCPTGYELVSCECVKIPCTTTCDSGYKLNNETCECELLPPCWGTTVEGLMPDGSGDQSQLVKALETMVNSFFKSSDLLETMRDIGILDSAELSKGFNNYLDGGDILGKISIGFVANDYNNNPTTENFMKIFVEGALLLLPPPASVGYTALDTLYQKYFDGKPFSEILAKKMAEFSAELFDCDLGSGVYGLIH